MSNRYLEILKNRTILFDGAMGTQIQKCNLHAHDFGGEHLEGANDHLVITRPDIIEQIYREYLSAGADVLETNSFGSNRLKLEEYKLEDVREHNVSAAQLARKVADEFSTPERPRFVFGSIGPTGMLPSSTDPDLSNITFDQLYNLFEEQSYHLIEGGVDGLLIETSQDILEVKAAINGCRDAIARAAKDKLIKNESDIVVQCQITLDATGRMLLGTDVKAALAILEPLSVDVIGINCSTGPHEMRDSVRYLLENSSKPISVIPNAGMPVNVDGHAAYNMDPDTFAREIFSFIKDFGLQVSGGCCGTTPDHIRALRKMIDEHSDVKPRLPQKNKLPLVASAITSASLFQEPAPAIIGERLNAQGSRKMKDLLLADDLDSMLTIARDQEEGGAHILDVCLAANERDDEAQTMQRLVKVLSGSVSLPLMVDSTEVSVIESALKAIPGRPVVNSINLEGDGKSKIHSVMPLVKKYGAAVVALTIDEKGMADTVEWKLEVARRIHKIVVEEYGLNPHDILFDCLTFTLATGDEKYNRSAIETLDAIKKVKQELPGVFTTLGLSNISFGFTPAARKVLNSVFLFHAVKYGLDTAILNPKDIIPYGQLTQEDITTAEDLIFYKKPDALQNFIAHFDNRKIDSGEKKTDKKELMSKMAPAERIHYQIVNRISEEVDTVLAEVLKNHTAIDTINNILLPAMKEVGEKFGSGELILPFVLQSAEVMKKSVAYVEQFLDKNDSASKGTIVLATVYGDVHDIGKNLVKTILSNNGFNVVDLGKQVPVSNIIEEAKKSQAIAIGLSALLVSTSKQMGICVDELKKESLAFPVIVGGAAINRKYSYQISFPSGGAYYDPGVFYAKDAFEGLNIANQLASQETRSHLLEDVRQHALKSIKVTDISDTAEEDNTARSSIIQESPLLKPPFLGRKVLRNISFQEIFNIIDKNYLFKFKWGVRTRGEEYATQIKEIFMPKLLSLAEEAQKNNWLSLDLVYGYYRARSEKNTITLYDESGLELEQFAFPRQKNDEKLSLSDYISDKKDDYLALTAVTAGQISADIINQLQEAGELEKSYLFAGFSTQMAEGLAEYIHREIRKEWGIGNNGLRYSFGYPACPELKDQEKLYRLLRPQEINLGLTEAWQMIPEQSTSALIFQHPQCTYFKI